MKKENIELYLSEDIIQGEEIPFYLIWDRNDIESIKFDFSGFTKILEFHNIKDDFVFHNNIVKINDLKTPYYFGGVLQSEKSKKPFKKSYLKVTFFLKSDNKIELAEERTLYSTKLDIKELPKEIQIPFKKPPIKIQLTGSTTIFLDIASSKNSEILVDLPEDVKNALEKMYENFEIGLKNLKEEFSQYNYFIDILLKSLKQPPEQKIFDELMKKFEKIKNDKSFLEALSVVAYNSLLGQASIKDRVLVPLMTYFSSAASRKAFLVSPFSCLYVPKGGGKLKLEIIFKNIVEYYECRENKDAEIESQIIETMIESDKDIIVPVKEIIDIRRI